MPALIPKEVEIQRLKKIWLIVIAMGSIAASVEVDNFVDGSLHQTSIRDSAFTPAHWWLYSHFVALPLGWGSVAIYDRKVPILRGPNNSMNTGLKMTICVIPCYYYFRYKAKYSQIYVNHLKLS